MPGDDLLALGNRKLGDQTAHFDLPAGAGHCPGATACCLRACYALTGRYRYPSVRRRLRRCLAAARRPGFVRRVIGEVRRRGLLLIRLHCSGDFFSELYAEGWLAITRALPRVKVWWYTRSWRVPAIEAVLRRMAVLPNCRGWYSLDRDCLDEAPAERPPGVRYCYLQDGDDAPGEVDADLVFRTRAALHRPVASLPLVCPTDTPHGRRSGQISCGSCGVCFD